MTNNDKLDTNTAKVNLPLMFRLGLFQMGLSMMSVLTLGILSRVMIQEIAMPATLVSMVLAIPAFISPSRVWFGQISDAKSMWGYHRTGYVWLGTGIFAIASFVALQVIWQLNRVASHTGSWVWTTPTIGWTALLCLVAAIYGSASYLASALTFLSTLSSTTIGNLASFAYSCGGNTRGYGKSTNL